MIVLNALFLLWATLGCMDAAPAYFPDHLLALITHRGSCLSEMVNMSAAARRFKNIVSPYIPRNLKPGCAAYMPNFCLYDNHVNVEFLDSNADAVGEHDFAIECYSGIIRHLARKGITMVAARPDQKSAFVDMFHNYLVRFGGDYYLGKTALERGNFGIDLDNPFGSPLDDPVDDKLRDVFAFDVLDRDSLDHVQGSSRDDYHTFLYALFFGRLELAKEFLPRVTRPQLKNLPDIHDQVLLKSNSSIEISQGPLHLAVRSGQHEVVKLLLDSMPKILGTTAHINSRDSVGRTPLEWAVINGHVAVADLLIDHGAAWNETLYEHAVYGGGLNMIRMLFHHARPEKDIGSGLLHHAMSYANDLDPNFEVLAWLVKEFDLDIDARYNGQTTLFKCLGLETHLNIASWLIQKGANINAMDNNGQPLLFHVIKTSSELAVEFIVGQDEIDLHVIVPPAATPCGFSTPHSALSVAAERPIAAKKTKENIIYSIVWNSINVNKRQNGYTILNTVLEAYVKKIEEFIRYGGLPDLIDEATSETLETALDLTANLHQEVSGKMNHCDFKKKQRWVAESIQSRIEFVSTLITRKLKKKKKGQRQYDFNLLSELPDL